MQKISSQENTVVLLKVSGEALGGRSRSGFDKDAMDSLAGEIVSVKNLCKLAIVIGGGNLIRGSRLKQEVGLEDSVVADYAGMLATVINAITFQEVLERKFGLETRVLSAIEARTVAEPYIRRKALSHLEKGRVVLLCGGTGNPDFSTDTAMVLRAHEIGAGMVLKGTKVDGIFDKDPERFKDAKPIERISYLEYLNKHLEIIDATAVTLASKHGLTVRIFNIFKKGNLKKVLMGEPIGSTISN